MNYALLWNEFKNMCGDMQVLDPSSEEKTIREVMEVVEEMFYNRSIKEKERESICSDPSCKKRHTCSRNKKDCSFETVNPHAILKHNK